MFSSCWVSQFSHSIFSYYFYRFTDLQTFTDFKTNKNQYNLYIYNLSIHI